MEKDLLPVPPPPEQNPLPPAPPPPEPLPTTPEQKGHGDDTVDRDDHYDPYYDGDGNLLFHNDKCLICQPKSTLNEKSSFVNTKGIKNNNEFVKAFNCGHGFHYECFNRFQNYHNKRITCPVCKAQFIANIQDGKIDIHTFSDRIRTWDHHIPDHIPEPSAATRYGGNKPNKHRSNKRRQKKNNKTKHTRRRRKNKKTMM